jgi:hypothetical protein
MRNTIAWRFVRIDIVSQSSFCRRLRGFVFISAPTVDFIHGYLLPPYPRLRQESPQSQLL